MLEATVSGKKNLIFDTTLGNGQWASELIKDLRAKGYEVEVRAVASPKLESELGVDKRFAEKLDDEGYGRHVPEGARDAIYGKLPTSLDTTHAHTDVPSTAAWTDNRRIYHQDDRQGHTWTYDPDQPAQGWQRKAPIDASNDLRLE